MITLDNTIVQAYQFIVERIAFFIGISILTIFNKVEDWNWNSLGMAAFWENYQFLIPMFIFLFGLSLVVRLVKWTEGIYFRMTPTERRLKRKRFSDLEQRAVENEEYTTLYTNWYWSDDEEDGAWSDPDVAWLNFQEWTKKQPKPSSRTAGI